jgi:heptosyltransferase I
MPSSASPETSGIRPDPQRFLIVRLGSMGDIIHTLPAVTALRQALPEARIGWIVEEQWSELLCTLAHSRSGPRSPQRPLVDQLHTANTRAWRSALLSTETWERIGATFSELRAAQYDMAIDFQGALRSSLLARWSGSPVIYGFADPRESVASMFYSRRVIARGTHIVQQNLSLAEAIVHHACKVPKITFPRDETVERQCDARLKEKNISDFVMLNPGAGWGAKQWPAERYGIVAKTLAQHGLTALVNYGPGEKELARTVESMSGGVAEGITCSITELIALTRRARLFIGGDTGPMHLAAAVGVPVVAIFGPTDPQRNGPFGTCSVVLRSPSSRTSYSHRLSSDSGILEINTDAVIAAALQLLERLRA